MFFEIFPDREVKMNLFEKNTLENKRKIEMTIETSEKHAILADMHIKILKDKRTFGEEH